jgi:hypothetical protein
MKTPPHSPPRPYGSSRMTGGVLRGRALGNFLNAADLQHASEDVLHPIPGKVLVFVSGEDPANLTIENMKPTTFIKHSVTSSIQPVLTKIADKYSPIRSKYYNLLILMVIKMVFSVLESRLFTYEDGLWNVRGRYEKAFEEDEELFWSKSGSEHLTYILMASIAYISFYFDSVIWIERYFQSSPD